MIWFPELFYRFEEFETYHPNEKATVCEVSSVVVTANATIGTKEFCGEPIADSVFLHTLIIGLACIPTSFWLPLCVHRLGAKFFLGWLSFNRFFFRTSLNWRNSFQFTSSWISNDRTVLRWLHQHQSSFVLHFWSSDQFGHQYRVLRYGRLVSH